MDNETRPCLGTATLDPSGPVVAGSVGTWTLVYTVGSYGIDEGGTIKIAQRFASDWESPQFSNPALSGYTTVDTNGEVQLRWRFDQKGHKRPWMKWCLIIDVVEGSLAPGENVRIILGDRSGGSPGIRSQTFQEKHHEFRVFVDPTNACVARSIDHSPSISIAAGIPAELVCILPSDVMVGETIEIFVKGEDRWRNPATVSDNLKLEWQGDADAVLDGLRIKFLTSGTGRISVAAGSLRCLSNPIIARSSPPRFRRYWGDLHGQTVSTLGVGTEEEYFTFARDIARLDFTSHQANDFQLSEDAWKHLNDVVAHFHEDQQFVVFPGYEWSANTPVGGDRNVFFFEENMPIIRSSHWQISNVPEDSRALGQPADVFFSRIRSECDVGKVLIGSHAGGRYSDIRGYFDDELGPLVEVMSGWGIFEWLLWDALEKNYLVGVMCNSDSHKGRPGAEGPGAGQFGIASGLTCVLAEARTRKEIWSALKDRRCYGTTGPRILLEFQIDGHDMGSLVDIAGPARVWGKAYGTAPIESLTLFRRNQVVQTVYPHEFSSCFKSNRIRVSWQGARTRGRSRRTKWNGVIHLDRSNILSASPYQFDTPADGIESLTSNSLSFRSQTVGDCDGIDLILDKPSQGTLSFRSSVGDCDVELSTLFPPERAKVFEFGSEGLKVKVERYPQQLTEYSIVFETVIQASSPLEPYLLKLIQEDGHMAWSSPIYLRSSKKA